MAPKYKLVYFDARGRMEATRLALEYSGIPYEDQRIKKDDWPAVKASKDPEELSVLYCVERYTQRNFHNAATQYCPEKGFKRFQRTHVLVFSR